jgi:hypothetical protein
MARLTYDIVIIGDLRLPGATGRAIAEEVRALAKGGYRAALLHMQSPLLERPKLINPLIRVRIDGGLADLVDPEVPIAARLVLAHHPGLFLHLPARVPQIQADCKLLIVNHPLLDAEGNSYFRAGEGGWTRTGATHTMRGSGARTGEARAISLARQRTCAEGEAA